MPLCPCNRCDRVKGGLLTHCLDATFHHYPNTHIEICDCRSCNKTLDGLYAHAYHRATGYFLPRGVPRPNMFAEPPSPRPSSSESDSDSSDDDPISVHSSAGSPGTDSDSDLPMAPLTQGGPPPPSSPQPTSPVQESPSPKTPTQNSSTPSPTTPPKPPTKSKKSLSWSDPKKVRWAPVQFEVECCTECEAQQCDHIKRIEIQVSDDDEADSGPSSQNKNI